ncbi:tripartite tricarboxylate transporter substrate binding protein [Reyranella sp. CPCC 100927]|uniref:Bug family tripartite tricarboxylate transporter substrate binding protein n=1 Tax=Reyranella sp. CPCC 100927 TaxID=2599616 RepID=UPI001C498CAB|nr:tripartite tricarboxylate transporter substrate-binding protein [Reyranella sp. CPCC 100927]
MLVAVALAFGPAAVVAAEPFPSKPVRIIVNSAPGALLDATTRRVAQKMWDILGQPVVVENKTGADGLLGIRFVRGVAADGYTLLATANTIAQQPSLKLDPGYDLEKDFVGVGPMLRAPLIMVGAPNGRDKTLADLIARAKANPDALTFASGGVGTTTHITAALLMNQAGIKLMHVPYKGSSAALSDLLTGRVDMMFDGTNLAGPLVQQGRLRAFGISSPQRSAAFPDIPAIAEQGLPSYSFYVYLGLVAPSGTPRDVVQRLSHALRAALASEDIADRFRREGYEAFALGPDEFTDFLRKDAARAAKLATDLGLPKE